MGPGDGGFNSSVSCCLEPSYPQTHIKRYVKCGSNPILKVFVKIHIFFRICFSFFIGGGNISATREAITKLWF